MKIEIPAKALLIFAPVAMLVHTMFLVRIVEWFARTEFSPWAYGLPATLTIFVATAIVWGVLVEDR